MKIGVLGTGVVGQTIAGKLGELGHEVRIGTRDVEAALARTAPDNLGNPPFKVWREQHAAIGVGTFADVAAGSELLVNATQGAVSLDVLQAAGEKNLAGKILIDISNSLDFSKGFPPSLLVCNTDSLGERIQHAFPQTKVVKTLHTVNANLMVAPRQLADGAHTMFVSANDAEAKATVTKLLESFGWRDVVDLGDITTARGTEMMLPIWVRLYGALKTPTFSFKLVR